MATIFSRIVSGEIPCYKVAETEKFLAFLDINPLAMGHTLVIPKAEIDYLFDMEETQYADLFLFARQVALALGKAIPCKKVGVAVIGLEVAHAHIHLVPINEIYDIDFRKAKLSFSTAEFVETATRIASAIL
ncbi:MAG: HIT family protein [Bacteroidales bacterium]|nr:HIT family protein [Bacteroidales bacterium]MDZ4203884.1 HIT family protein [Bacteroidales bacterium]